MYVGGDGTGEVQRGCNSPLWNSFVHRFGRKFNLLAVSRDQRYSGSVKTDSQADKIDRAFVLVEIFKPKNIEPHESIQIWIWTEQVGRDFRKMKKTGTDTGKKNKRMCRFHSIGIDVE